MWPFKRKIVDRSSELLEQISKMRQYTPDMAFLERKAEHNLFVCDELRPGLHKHSMLKDQRNTGYQAFTQNFCMMLYHDLGKESYPLVFPSGLDYHNPPKLLPIKGELYKVEPRLFLELDRYRQNGVQFFREEVLIVVPLTQIWFKDRQDADNLYGEKKGFAGRTGSPVQTCLFHDRGVYRVRAWMYFAMYDYWGDLLNINVLHPPVTQHTSKEGVIKRYYSFSDIECDGPPF